MTNTNIATFPRTTKSPAKQHVSRESRLMAKRFTRQAYAASAVGLVAMVLTGVSLSHLATGIQIVTGCQCWESWATAVSIDLLFVAMEMGTLMSATDKIRQSVACYTGPAVAGTMTISAVLNAFAFGAHAAGWMVYPAAALGLVVPALIYVGTKVAAKLWISVHSR